MSAISGWDWIVFTGWMLCATLLVLHCRTKGHITTEMWVFVGATSTCWLEVTWDWLLFVRFNHDAFLMLPDGLPYFDLAGGLPVNAPFIYGLWFFVPAVAAKVLLGDRDLSKTAIIIALFIFSALFEGLAETLLFINPERYAYTHVIPGLAWAEGTPHQYPLDVPIWVGASVALAGFILLRGLSVAKGETVLPRGASMWARFGRLRAVGGTEGSFTVNAIAAILFANITYLLAMIPAVAIRFAGMRTLAGDAMPFGHGAWPGL